MTGLSEDGSNFTNEQWREFQRIPDQGYSHRVWLDHHIDCIKADTVAAERARWVAGVEALANDYAHGLDGRDHFCEVGECPACQTADDLRKLVADLTDGGPL